MTELTEKEFINLLPDYPNLPILVPTDIPTDLRLRLTAAIKSFLMGAKSMDYLLKQYGDVWAAHIEQEGKTKH